MLTKRSPSIREHENIYYSHEQERSICNTRLREVRFGLGLARSPEPEQKEPEQKRFGERKRSDRIGG